MKIKRSLLLLLLGLLVFTACALPGLAPTPPTETPGPSPTPTTPPALTPTPTSPPTPTPLPAARIGAGDRALANGDYFHSHDEYQVALASSSDDNVRAAALWGLGKTAFLYENYSGALDFLRSLVEAHPQSEQAIRAHFLMGETYFTLKRYQDAADSYASFLQLRPGLLDAYVQEQRGDALSALANYPAALAAYQAALQADGQASPNLIRIQIAQSYEYGGDPATALSLYDEVFAATGNDYVKAQMDFLAGRALLQLERQEEAYGRWRHAVENYPLSFDSYSALVGLVEAGQPVDDFNRGLVDYFAGQYGLALAALDRYIANHSGHDGTPLYYKGLTLFSLGNYQEAVQVWDEFIQRYPDNPRWSDAWDANPNSNGVLVPGRAYTQWYFLDQPSAAAQGLELYANQFSSAPLAASYLLEAGRIYERAGKLDEAAAAWESLPDKFPSDSAINEATFQGGIVRYRQGNYPKALEDFQRSLSLTDDPSIRARAWLWIGKTYQASGDGANTLSAWQQAQAIDPSGYYSLRARDLLEGRPPFAPAPTYNLNYDLISERAAAAAWLRIKFDLPADTDLAGPGALGADTRLQRGTEFWRLGLYDEARLEFEALREAVQDNPADSFRLGNYMLDLGLYRPAIVALRQVLTLAGMDEHAESLTAPIYFKHVRYGLYYADIVWPTAAEHGLDPLLVTSLIRQESLFEGFASSSANAFGLMQIIPTTGAGIARDMGWPPNYSQNDLYSPYISIRMGTYYLNGRRSVFNGDLYAALAAYNSGDGAAQIWKDLAKGDQDLFLEITRFSQTRDYVRGIYEIYTTYRSLYSPMQ